MTAPDQRHAASSVARIALLFGLPASLPGAAWASSFPGQRFRTRPASVGGTRAAGPAPGRPPRDRRRSRVGKLVAEAAAPTGDEIVVLSQKVVSKAEGRLRSLGEVEPGEEASRLAALPTSARTRRGRAGLGESRDEMRAERGVLITETTLGWSARTPGIGIHLPGEGPGGTSAPTIPSPARADPEPRYEATGTLPPVRSRTASAALAPWSGRGGDRLRGPAPPRRLARTRRRRRAHADGDCDRDRRRARRGSRPGPRQGPRRPRRGHPRPRSRPGHRRGRPRQRARLRRPADEDWFR